MSRSTQFRSRALVAALFVAALLAFPAAAGAGSGGVAPGGSGGASQTVAGGKAKLLPSGLAAAPANAPAAVKRAIAAGNAIDRGRLLHRRRAPQLALALL